MATEVVPLSDIRILEKSPAEWAKWITSMAPEHREDFNVLALETAYKLGFAAGLVHDPRKPPPWPVDEEAKPQEELSLNG